jgi:CheY-like chemotaxis protein
MPQLDGFAIIARLQNDSKYSHLTPIVVTGMSEEKITASNLPSSVSVLHKPIPVEALKELVLQAVKR